VCFIQQVIGEGLRAQPFKPPPPFATATSSGSRPISPKPNGHTNGTSSSNGNGASDQQQHSHRRTGSRSLSPRPGLRGDVATANMNISGIGSSEQQHTVPGATALGARALLGLAVFSGASFVILMSHLMPWWLLLSGILTVLAPMLLLAIILDRYVYAFGSTYFNRSCTRKYYRCVNYQAIRLAIKCCKAVLHVAEYIVTFA
jgi:hypothetical protein